MNEYTLEIQVPITEIPKRQQKEQLIESIQSSLKISGLDSISFSRTYYNEKLGAGFGQVIVIALNVAGSVVTLAKAIYDLNEHSAQRPE